MPCRPSRNYCCAPAAATQPPPAGARDELGAARRSSLDLKLVDPLGLEPRPDGLRDRCAAVTPRVNAGKGGGNCIPIIGFGDRGSAVELRPYEAVERVARIELASSVWKTAASPFGQTRIEFGRRSWTRTKEVAWTTVLRTAARDLFTLKKRDALVRNADGCAKGGAVNGGSIHKPLDKADAALRTNPKGKTDCGRSALLPLRLLASANGARGA